jgi:hypothetical protein
MATQKPIHTIRPGMLEAAIWENHPRAGDTPETTSQYFGGCPVCGKHDGYLNVRRAHFFLCRQHKTCWCVGENLFRSWREESPAVWKRHERRLRRHYRLVEPVYAAPEK